METNSHQPDQNKIDERLENAGITQGHNKDGHQETVSQERPENDTDTTNHGQASFRTGSTTQGGSNYGQGSSHLGGEAYHQGDTKNSGASYDTETNRMGDVGTDSTLNESASGEGQISSGSSDIPSGQNAKED